MTAATLVAVAAVLVGATVQSGLGFGLAILAAPVVAAVDGPALAAPTLSVVGFATSGLLLLAERRERHVLWPAARALIGWTIPGMFVGAALLALVPVTGLSVLVAVAVLVAVGLQARTLRPPVVDGAPVVGHAPAGLRSPAVAGFGSGVMQTSTGLNGPPLVLHLLGRTTAPQARDTLAAVFLAANLLGVVVFLLTGTFRVAGHWPLLLGAGVAGWALGRLLFPLIARWHAALSLAVVVLGATAALVQVALATS